MKEIIELEKEYIQPTYGRYDLVIEHGKGCCVYDFDGKEYLDFISGIACVSCGHGNEEITEAIFNQAKKLIQVSNLYYTGPQVLLAQKLVELSGLGKCFFCNSGAEANESAIKLAKRVTGKKKFIAFEHSFHGRTTGSLAATWKPKFKEAFKPLMPDVIFVRYNNIDELEKVITKDIAAVIIEPIQGEAGIIVPGKGYLKKVEEICNKNNILLIVDEVQTGNGRTGKFFAYLYENVKPDIVTLAKGLANGMPIGVCIAKKGIDFEKGDHASTFGGNNLCCTAALATINYIEKNNLMQNAEKTGNYFMKKLKGLNKDIIKEVRGKGLMIGVELKENKAKEIVDKCLQRGLLLNNATENVLRFLPPLIVTEKEIDKAIKILDDVL